MFRVGIIGVGNMGSVHLANLVTGKVKGAKLTAVCDIDKEHLYQHKDKMDDDVLYFDNEMNLINILQK